jgi:hypothetical protein
VTDQAGSSDFKPSTRGDAAWQEARDGIASRNAATRRAGKVERETYEREREAMKHAAAAARQAQRRGRRSG